MVIIFYHIVEFRSQSEHPTGQSYCQEIKNVLNDIRRLLLARVVFTVIQNK